MPKFETGKPVTFGYLHNKEKAPYMGSQFHQDIEPAGRYVIEFDNDEHFDYLDKNRPGQYEKGKITFNSPLVIKVDSPLDHKKILHDKYKKKGKALSKAIVKDGYDGIVTIGSDGETGEIIDLRMFKESLMTKSQKLLHMLESSGSMDNLVREYVISLLWSENEEDGTPLDDNYSYTDMSEEALQQIKNDIKKFLDQATDLIDNDEKQGGDYKQAMHDFLLTRNGHGAGFWDGDWSNGDELTKIAKSFGNMNAYAGDDGKIYIM